MWGNKLAKVTSEQSGEKCRSHGICLKNVMLLYFCEFSCLNVFGNIFCYNKIVFFNQLTMAINGPNEAPNTITTIKPSLTKFKGEKSQIFTPQILSCFSARWEKYIYIFLSPICPLLHIYGLTGGESSSAFKHTERILNDCKTKEWPHYNKNIKVIILLCKL